MANAGEAIEYVLGFEDAGLTGVITQYEWEGKTYRTRFGIDERFHPELTNCLYYESMGLTAALQIAKSIYDISYCQPLCIAEISAQPVADKLLSLGVNCGVGTAAKMLQDVLHVNGDGRIGPLTLDALDKADVVSVLSGLKLRAVERYHELIAANPALGIYEKGWIRRAEA